MKRLLCLLAAACLLVGCAALPTAQGGAPGPTLAPAPTAAPQTLRVYGAQQGTAARAALQAYADAQGVALADAGTPAEADLAVLDAAPADGEPSGVQWRDLSQDPLLAGAALRAGFAEGEPVTALPLGRCLYAYWADEAVLDALLGDGALADLQNATWAEWSALAEALTGWLDAPAETTVTLNGNAHTLPAEKPAAAAGLAGVFAVARGSPAADGPAFTAAVLAAGEERTAGTLGGALNGLCSAFILEQQNAAGAFDLPADAAAALADGTALFCRLPLCELAVGQSDGLCARLVPVPIKTDLVADDLATGEYNLIGLTNYPVLAQAGVLALPDNGEDSARAGAAAILWLYTSAEGEAALTEALHLVTPWDTASDADALGQRQIDLVSTGILPAPTLPGATLEALHAAAEALRDAGDGKGQWAAAARKAFRESAAEALAQ